MNKSYPQKYFVKPEKLWNDLENATKEPQKAQKEILKSILKENSGTFFGEKYKFNKIKTPSDFRRAVPIKTFEALEPLLRAQDSFKKPYLTCEQPAYYVQSSGTTGRSKFIPVLKNTIEQANLRSAIFNFLHFSEGGGGKILSIVGAATEGTTENGTPCGSYSGLLYDLLSEEAMKNFVLPKSIFGIEEYEAKYLLISGLALAEKEIGVLVGANPAIFLKLIDTIKNNWENLMSFVKSGDVRALGLDGSYKKFLPKNFKGHPQRFKALRKTVPDIENITFCELWPSIHSLVTWTSGSCGFVLPKVKSILPSSCRILDMGYLASEFIGTITIDSKTNAQVPFLTENYYEFIEPEEWGKNGIWGKVLGLDELGKGKLYFIIVSTQTGLYRYFINDLVEKTGSFNKTPTIRFVQKGKGVTNIAGELLYENQLLSAMNSLTCKDGSGVEFFILMGDPEEQKYTLYYEGEGEKKFLDSKLFEKELAKYNAGIEVMRKDGTLKKTEMIALKKGTGEAYKKHCLRRGQREAQYKFLALQNKQDNDFDLDSYKFRG